MNTLNLISTRNSGNFNNAVSYDYTRYFGFCLIYFVPVKKLLSDCKYFDNSIPTGSKQGLK